MERMLKCGIFVFLFLCVLSPCVVGRHDICQREPRHTTAKRTPGDDGFSIQVKGLPAQGIYRPGETYSVVVKNTGRALESNTRLRGVMLVAVKQGAKDETHTVGNFSTPTENVDRAKGCDHTVIMHHYLDKKYKVKVDWQAPSHGCVDFRATVISEDATKWFKDDGGLTLTICSESEKDVKAQGDGTPLQDTPECCACGEARYKMVFQGLWSRQTHPKGFPTGRDALMLHWSNIVGATHTEDYNIWEYGGFAERGVREVCEYGFSSVLEKDMKQNSDKIYTVLKTTPMWRDVLGKREAVFKVNQKAHLVSLLTMIGPSPDWCLGIPSMSMCQANCTWADEIVVPLYPWDAGTDDGITYVNARKKPSDPRERIHRITHMFPKDREAPFSGKHPVKPMATVTLTKLKEVCGGDGSQSTDEGTPSTEDLITMMKKKMMMTKKLEMMKCATTEWLEWTDCSNNCGSGMRQRSRDLINENILPSMCSVDLMEKESCEGKCMEGGQGSKTGRDKLSDNFEVRHTYELDLNDPCVVTPWSDWSPCSAKVCGRGIRERWRMFLRKSAQLMNCGVSIMEKDLCFGIIPDCRKAFMMKNFTAICSLPKNDGPCRGNFKRWHYDSNMRKCLPFRYGGCRGNDNIFENEDECKTQCADYMENIDETFSNKAELMEPSEADLKRMMKKKQMMANNSGPQLDSTNIDNNNVDFNMRKKRKMMKKQKQMDKTKRRERRKQMKEKLRRMRENNDNNKIDCMVTEWTAWDTCPQTCGSHYRTRNRMIKRPAENGGKKCPKKLSRRRKCRKTHKCPRDCKLSEWGSWGACTATCGQDAVKERVREVKVKPKFEGMDCPSLMERTSCNLSACMDDVKDMKQIKEDMTRHSPTN